MKKFYLLFFLVIFFCNIGWTQSSLPECEGNDENISKYTKKHFRKMRKWTNCHGTAMGPDEQKYVGEFYKGEFHGNGIFRHEGREYVGQYKHHKRYGQGTYTYANGDMYVGNWKEHKYYGEGTYIYSNGDKYIGEWKKDKYFKPDNSSERSGKGTYIYINGDKYIGEWKKGKRHGQGTLTYADGRVEKGVWKKGKLIESK
jgi:hypothetical protein